MLALYILLKIPNLCRCRLRMNSVCPSFCVAMHKSLWSFLAVSLLSIFATQVVCLHSVLLEKEIIWNAMNFLPLNACGSQHSVSIERMCQSTLCEHWTHVSVNIVWALYACQHCVSIERMCQWTLCEHWTHVSVNIVWALNACVSLNVVWAMNACLSEHSVSIERMCQWTLCEHWTHVSVNIVWALNACLSEHSVSVERMC